MNPPLEVRAVIDVGSNSVTMTLMARSGLGGWEEVDAESEVTGLGEGTKETGLLGDEPMARTLAAMKSLWTRAEVRGATIRAAATMAARIAMNAADFQLRAMAQGTPVAILSGDAEAALGTRAVLDDPIFGGAEDLAIIDIGGQSTELTILSQREIRFQKSMPFGTLALRNRFFSSDGVQGRVEGRTLFGASGALDRMIEVEYERGKVPFPTGGTIVALGGGPGQIVAIREAMTQWDPARIHGARLEYEELGRAVGWLMPMSDAERADVVVLQPKLCRTIHICALILERTTFALRGEEVRAGVRGWRHGLLMDDARFEGLSLDAL